jgi:hypothetical protein
MKARATLRAGSLLLLTLLLCAQPLLVTALSLDRIYELRQWTLLVESHEIGIVTLLNVDEAMVDLFIAPLSETDGQQSEVYVLPLGSDPIGLAVQEKARRDFADEATLDLDSVLRKAASSNRLYNADVSAALLVGTLFMHGGWIWPLWYFGPFSSQAIEEYLFGYTVLSHQGNNDLQVIGSAPGQDAAEHAVRPIVRPVLSSRSALAELAPLAMYETEHAHVAIYAIEEDTDLDQVISAIGLEPALREALERLRGQQVAIVTAKQYPPRPPEERMAQSRFAYEPGLHLRWTTSLAPGSDGPSLDFSIGATIGRGRPVELALVYIVAAPASDFAVRYPQVGQNMAGYDRDTRMPHLMDATQPAYAVDEATWEEGRIWRISYLHSDLDHRVGVTHLLDRSEVVQEALQQEVTRQGLLRTTGPLSALIGMVVWVLAWSLVMPRKLEGPDGKWSLAYLGQAVGWMTVYLLSTVVMGLIARELIRSSMGMLTCLVAPPLLFVGLGGVSLYYYARQQRRNRGIPERESVHIYLSIVGVANVLYLVYAVLHILLAVTM